jgi:hypothetical protein
MDYLIEIIIAVVISMIITALGAVIAFLGKRNKEYKTLLQNRETESVRSLIHQEIQPLEEELGRLTKALADARQEEEEHIAIIQGSYKFRLIHLCKTYIRQGYITSDQFESLSEFYRVYTGLGGNGQAAEFYDRVMELPLHE